MWARLHPLHLGPRTGGTLMVMPHPVPDNSMLSVDAALAAFLGRPAHDPARKAGNIVQVVDLKELPGGY